MTNSPDGSKKDDDPEVPVSPSPHSPAAAISISPAKVKPKDKDEKKTDKQESTDFKEAQLVKEKNNSKEKDKEKEKDKNKKTQNRKKPDKADKSPSVEKQEASVVKGVQEKTERSRILPTEGQLRMQLNFQTPKDETDLATLRLEGVLATNAKLLEEYKIAIQQVHNTLILMMRRGNGTTDMENIKSEKNHSAPERLNKDVLQTENFWKCDPKLQPAMNESIAKNTAQLATAERRLQERGPRHMKRIHKFLYQYYPEYMELKKEMAKILAKNKPDSQDARENVQKKIEKFVKDKYLNQKTSHLGEIQSAFMEIAMYHHASTSLWYQISERKMPKSTHFHGDSFDFQQFFAQKKE